MLGRVLGFGARTLLKERKKKSTLTRLKIQYTIKANFTAFIQKVELLKMTTAIYVHTCHIPISIWNI